MLSPDLGHCLAASRSEERQETVDLQNGNRRYNFGAIVLFTCVSYGQHSRGRRKEKEFLRGPAVEGAEVWNRARILTVVLLCSNLELPLLP